MITDALLLLDNANASIRGANTYVSTNTIDLSVARDIGAARNLIMIYSIDVAFAGGTSVQPQQITSASADLSTPTVIDQGRVYLTAALVVGAIFARMVPEVIGGVAGIGSTGQRYYGAQYVSVGTYTAGSITARIVLDTVDVKLHASGYTIV